MQKPRQLSLSTFLTVCVITILTDVFNVTAQRPAEYQPQIGPKDTLIIKKADSNPPIEILMIRTKKGVVEAGKPYSDDNDWLDGFTVGLANSSGKAVTYIDVELLFNRPKDQIYEPPAVWHLEYGDNPFRYKTTQQIPPMRVQPLLPGDTHELRLSDRDLEQLTIFLKDAKYAPSINKIEVRVNAIGFSDGLAWFGRMLTRDPTSPTGWRPLDPPDKGESKLEETKAVQIRTASFFGRFKNLN